MRRAGLIERRVPASYGRVPLIGGGGGGSAAPFSPSDITGLVAWFDMQDTGAYTEAGGFVTTITNKASSTVWSAAVGERPAYSATGLNSLPCMDFDGINDKVMDTEAAVIAALADQNDYYLAAVIDADDLDAVEVFFSVADSGAAGPGSKRWGTNTTGNGKFTAIGTNDASSGIVVDSTGDTVTDPVLYEAYCESAATSIHISSATAAPAGTATAYGVLTPDRAALGCRPSSTLATFFDGRVGELLVYSGAISAGNKALVRAYLAAKWVITLS
jgi:hypothetical protein